MKDLHTLDQYRVDMRHLYGTMGDSGAKDTNVLSKEEE